MATDVFRHFVSPGKACLTLSIEVHRELIAAIASRPITPTVVLALRKQVGDVTANSLLEIAGCQRKAIAKFGDGVWMATARSLQQATDRVVANYKASMFQDLIVVDLCGGVGGDAMGFARRGPVVTVDLDPLMTRMAAENLRSINAQDAIAVNADAMTYFTLNQLTSGKIGLHIDPDRRPDEQRTTAPDRYSPSFDFVSAMIASSHAAIVKLAPAAQIDSFHATRHHRQWISYAGSVREQSLICGACIATAGLTEGGCSAVRLFPGGSTAVYSPPKIPGHHRPLTVEAVPLKYIVDLDPAVRAAGLSASFANDHAFACLGDVSGFFTTDQWLFDRECGSRGLIQGFECLWSGPADMKQLRKVVRDLSLTIEVVKVRGTDHDPVNLQSALRSKAPGKPATLVIGRSTSGVYAVLASKLSN